MSAKNGNYTFVVDMNMTKPQIAKLISEIYKVTVTGVRTMNFSGEKKKNYLGKKKITKPYKKAIVTLKDKESIDLFEEKKGKSKK